MFDLDKLATLLQGASITALLAMAIIGALARKWVPGAIYQERIGELRELQAERRVDYDTAARAVRVSEQTLHLLEECMRNGGNGKHD